MVIFPQVIWMLLFLGELTECVVVEGKWYPAKVAAERLRWRRYSNIKAATSNLMCSAAAMQKPWARLYCWNKPLCNLYNVNVTGFTDQTDEGETVDCRTRIPPSRCPSPFQDAGLLGCIHFERNRMDWQQAKQHCETTMQAELFTVPSLFMELGAYLRARGVSGWFSHAYL
ncbi:hypothetical protein SK128_000810 [Halocaridina rubra]|uniref:C-type lectin domain-containing protein n=1 Tax=Halocaridina rubra TaxID=373956 RepID=A0AAN9A3M1_HALRR